MVNFGPLNYGVLASSPFAFFGFLASSLRSIYASTSFLSSFACYLCIRRKIFLASLRPFASFGCNDAKGCKRMQKDAKGCRRYATKLRKRSVRETQARKVKKQRGSNPWFIAGNYMLEPRASQNSYLNLSDSLFFYGSRFM